eukprot:g4008.t1
MLKTLFKTVPKQRCVSVSSLRSFCATNNNKIDRRAVERKIVQDKTEYKKNATALRTMYMEEHQAYTAKVEALKAELEQRKENERQALREYKAKEADERRRVRTLEEKKKAAKALAAKAAKAEEAASWAGQIRKRREERFDFLREEQKYWLDGLDPSNPEWKNHIKDYCDAAFEKRSPWDTFMEDINRRNVSRATAVRFQHAPRPLFEKRESVLQRVQRAAKNTN